MVPLESQRHLFSVPEDVAYFNCAYNSPQLLESNQKLQRGVESKNHPWKRQINSFFDDAEKIRALCANLFYGDGDGFAIVPSVSYGISTAARAIEPSLKKGDQILNIAEEFPSNVLPWQRVAKETGAQMVIVATPDDGDWTKAILENITSQIKVVAISTCHWTNGSHIDLLSISKACKNNNTILVVDATQTLGAVPFSIQKTEPDFLVAAGYKWLLCPYGFSLLYVSEKWRNARPLEETWLARSNAQDFANLVNYSETYLPGARKFDVGQKCTPTILPGAIAALEQIKAWGIEQIANTLEDTNKQIIQYLEKYGFGLLKDSQRSPHMFGAQIPENYNGNLVAKLAQKEIYISQRSSAVRFAPYLHINENDMDRLWGALGEIIGNLYK